MAGERVVLRMGRDAPARIPPGLASRSAPAADRRTANSVAVFFGPDGRGRASRMSPVSKPASIFIVVTPVTSSPWAIAHCTGAAPRYFGSSEACTLTMPSGGMSRYSGNDLAVTHHDHDFRRQCGEFLHQLPACGRVSG